VEAADLKRYFIAFDAIAMGPQDSWVANNRRRINVTTAYLDGTLHPRGVLFADRRFTAESPLSYMVYTARAVKDFEGYALKAKTIYRFQADPQGDQIFASAVCSVSDSEGSGPASNEELDLDFYFRLYKPLPPDAPTEEHSAPSAAIVNLLANRTQFEKEVLPRLSRCTIRDRIPGKLSSAEIMVFRRESEVRERPIRFPRTFAEIEAISNSRSKNAAACDVRPPATDASGNGSASR
jgi:hypothetical protein